MMDHVIGPCSLSHAVHISKVMFDQSSPQAYRYHSLAVFVMFQARINKYNGYSIANSALKNGGIRGPIHPSVPSFLGAPGSSARKARRIASGALIPQKSGFG